MRSLIVVLLMLAAGSAHAMGTAWDDALLAWNRDGSAALLEHTTFRDGDASLGYMLVVAENRPVSVVFSVTIRDDGKNIEHETDDACVAAAKRLAARIAGLGFAGVTVSPAACKADRHAIVRVSAKATREVERSWVALAQGRTPTARETASWELANRVTPGYKPFVSDGSCSESNVTLDVANATGKLILVMSSWTCNDPIRVTVHAFEPRKGAYVEQDGD